MSRPPTLQQAIYNALVKHGAPMPVNALSDATGRAPSVIRQTLQCLIAKKLVSTVPAPEEAGYEYAVIVLAPYEGNWSSFSREELEKIKANVAYGVARWRTDWLATRRKFNEGRRILEAIEGNLNLRDLAGEEL